MLGAGQLKDHPTVIGKAAGATVIAAAMTLALVVAARTVDAVAKCEKDNGVCLYIFSLIFLQMAPIRSWKLFCLHRRQL